MKTYSKTRLHHKLFRITSLLTILLVVSTPLSACASPAKERVPIRERLQRIRERLRRSPDNLPPTGRPENREGANTDPNVQNPPDVSVDYTSGVETAIYSEADSTLAVGVVDDLTLQDSGRNRDIPLKIYYPTAEGSYPVVVFSHGAGGSREGFSHLGRFWAANGYISIHLTHRGTDTQVLEESGFEPIRQRAVEPQTWLERTQDVSFLVDSLNQIMADAPELSGKLNLDKIGMAGHSLGSHTTALISGATVQDSEITNQSLEDERFDAFIMISPPVSPQGSNRFGLNSSSWQAVEDPAMVISGTKDEFSSRAPAALREEPFEFMPAGDKYLAVIDGAEHASYGDRAENTADGQRRQAFVRALTLLMWDAYLKDDADAKEILQLGDIQNLTQQEVRFARK